MKVSLAASRFSILSLALSALWLVGAPAQAQLNPRVQVGALAAIPRARLTIAPQLQSYLVQNKAKVPPQVLDSQIVLRANIPFIKLKDGTERALIPLAQMEGAAKTTTADSIPAEFAEVAPYIRGAKITGGSQISQFKFNPGLVFSLNTDHRPSMTPIRDQKTRGTCVAFASNAALEVFPSIPDDLSEQYSNDLFMRKEGRPACEDGIKTIDSAGYLADGTVVESLWPYSDPGPACNATPPAATGSATKYKITASQQIDDNGPSGASIKNPAYLESILRSGKNIVFGTYVAWNSADQETVLDVVINSATGKPVDPWAGHAMLMVGYNANQDYFILKNSWGTGPGHDGYFYLSYDYIRTYAKYGYYIKSVSPNLVIVPRPGDLGKIHINPNLRVPRLNP